jgi:hypothetical protein
MQIVADVLASTGLLLAASISVLAWNSAAESLDSCRKLYLCLESTLLCSPLQKRLPQKLTTLFSTQERQDKLSLPR